MPNSPQSQQKKSPLFSKEKRASFVGSGELNQSNTLRLGTLLPLGGLEFDGLAIFEIPKPIPDDAREMYEEVFTTFVRSDKTVALLFTKPFHRTLSQSSLSLRLSNSKSFVGEPHQACPNVATGHE